MRANGAAFRPGLVGLLVGAGLIVSASLAAACNVPVFRYALERWRVQYDDDLYELVVFHRGPLSGEDRARLAAAEKFGITAADVANLLVTPVDVAEPLPARLEPLWEQQGKDSALPLAVLRYPDSPPAAPAVWSAPLAELHPEAVVDSPARRQVAQNLLAGHTAVWIFVPGADPQENAAARKTLEDELARQAAETVLPDLTADPSDELMLAIPLEVKFSVVEARRDEPREQVFLATLLASEPDLAELTEPMAFPVFGRGRALGALVGKGISGEVIADVVQFLSGPCSCQVKRQNPGFDLLLRMDWERELARLSAAAGTPLAELSGAAAAGGGLGKRPDPVAVPVAIPTGEESSAAGAAEPAAPDAKPVAAGDPAEPAGFRAVLWMLCGLAVAMIAGSGLVLARRAAGGRSGQR